MPRPIALSKTRFTTGLQCHKQLWLKVHEPDAEELVVDEVQQHTFDTGTRVGELARSYLGPGTLIEAEYWNKSAKVQQTAEAMKNGAERIFEASFEHQGVFAAVDGLERVGGAFRLVEVKSSTKLKDEHLPDIAVQRWVLDGAGVRVSEAQLMHLNGKCVAPKLDDLFVRTSATEESDALLPTVGPEVRRQLEMLAGPEPEVPIGDHCTSPYDCPFIDRCWKDVPRHHVGTLMNLHHTKEKHFRDNGIVTIHDIPSDFKLTDRQEVQRAAVLRGEMTVDRPALRAALAAYDVDRIAYLDFETVGEAVPVWDGCHPYEQIPVQMSCHVATRDGTLTHHAWIASGPEDPRPACARAVVEACAGADIVVVWHASMEKGCLERLAVGAPALKEELADVIARLTDLEVAYRAALYHPDFLGSYSLKPVVNTLLPPEDAYGNLPVNEGMLASVRLHKLMFAPDTVSNAERARWRQELLDYCGHDTLVMVKLLALLRTMA
ncbi:MAG TPA: DUF2779 domain-containing protein [Gemmatimonadales bacterium]|nr:DUF2779 domain-containing protein [Gemmatimonadales bacterium]